MQKNKWVLFGSSYGGSLAKWFSQTHPNMTDILIASSAPLELKYEMLGLITIQISLNSDTFLIKFFLLISLQII